jgi:hypothetical protein
MSGGQGNARTSVTTAKPMLINGWLKRGLPQQPQASDSIGTKFSNSLVRPVYLRTSDYSGNPIRRSRSA